MVNPLPEDKILAMSKLMAFANDNFIVAQMMQILLEKGKKKHCGKRRKCLLPAFYPFPTIFSKAFSSSGVKIRHCAVKSSVLCK